MDSTTMNTTCSNDYCVSFADVQAAATRIAGSAHITPVMTSISLNRAAGNRNVFFKVEALQKTGSFKFRGALNAVKCVQQQLQEATVTIADNDNSSATLSFVTHSSGNHAQALALAAVLAGSTATIVMPDTAPAVKRDAVADFGAKIVLVPAAERASTAQRIQRETGATFIHPSEDPRVIAGQGTVSLEMINQVKEINNGTPLDAVIIPVGGGGLASGNITTLRAMYGRNVKIVLAEPAALDDAKRSFQAGKLLGHEPDNPLDSVADGLKTTLGPHTWPIVRDGADAILTVEEVDILRATKLIWERLKICIEPSAGVGVAVLLSQEFQTKFANCRNVVVILCGGNVDIVDMVTKMKVAGL